MKVDIEGFDELMKNFNEMTDKMQKNYAWAAAKAGAMLIQEAAVDNAKLIDKPKRENDKEDSQIFPFIKAKRAPKLARSIAGGGAAYRIGVEGGAKGNLRVPPQYWRHVEFGTEKTRPQPFLRPAIANNVAAATNRVAQTLWDRMEKTKLAVARKQAREARKAARGRK